MGIAGILASAFDPVAATNEYLARIPAEKMARSVAYSHGNHWLGLWTFLFGSAIYLLLLQTGISARMRLFSERLVGAKRGEGVATGKRTWLVPVLYVALFVIVTTLVQLPLTIYAGYFREHHYEMSNLTLGGWFADEGKAFVLSLVVLSLGSILLYAVLRRVGRAWWIWTTALLVSFAALGAMVAPVYIAPMFNTYTRLKDPALREQLISIARANRIPADDIYVVDASKQTKRVSANVSGLFGTTRISLNDNLLNRCSPAAVRAVMAHEMGHYVLNHVLKGLIEVALVIGLSMAFVAWAFNKLVSRFGERWGIRGAAESGTPESLPRTRRAAIGVADPAALPLLLLLFGVYGMLTSPLLNSITRASETEADAFGLNAAREPDGMAEALLTLVEYRDPRPGKWEEIIFFDHPSGYTRILAAMTWKAENLGAASADTAHPEPKK